MTHGRLRTPVVRGWDRLYSAQRMCLSVRRGSPNRLRERRELLHRNPGRLASHGAMSDHLSMSFPISIPPSPDPGAGM